MAPVFFIIFVHQNKMKTELRERVFLLKGESAPLSYILPSRNTKRYPLLHFDGTSNRALRYAKNQKSPYEDEQDGNFIIEPIVFEDGVLRVAKNDVVLQKFLELHPGNGVVFEEFDSEKDAGEDIKEISLELDALLLAKEIGIEKCEAVVRSFIGSKVDLMTSQEIRRDTMVFARNNPMEFLKMVDDTRIKIANSVARMFDIGMLTVKNSGKDVYFNLSNNKKKLMTIPFGEERNDVLVAYFKTNEGMKVFSELEKELE